MEIKKRKNIMVQTGRAKGKFPMKEPPYSCKYWKGAGGPQAVWWVGYFQHTNIY